MSHLPQRTEKNCLNCGTEVQGRYCQNCGQENIEPKESFWHLITHFFNDFTHFDGKFFSTLKYLIAKPGFLSLEYMKGRRQSYLHPIRMYVFTSAFFFIIFFSLFHASDIVKSSNVSIGTDSASLLKANRTALQYVDNAEDSAMIQRRIDAILRTGKDTTKHKNSLAFSVTQSEYKSVAEYDSAQKKLPKEKRDGWIKRKFARKSIEVNKRYEGDPKQFWYDVMNNFLHQFPKLFFISLPLFALVLKLLYIRRKQYYYADHSIFTIHLYIFSYIFFLVFFGISQIADRFPSDAWGWLMFVLWLYWFYYGYKSMRRFYQQKRFKTIVKYLLLNLFALVIMITLFALFFSYTVLYM